jgi:pSer/pThr/pTyr-binding forkhead associated (FHA) protein
MLSMSPAYPALYLYPLNDSFFIPKQMTLTTPGRRVQLGRKTSKCPPHVQDRKQVNFDSSVVSRRHAEVWQEGNKVRRWDVYVSSATDAPKNCSIQIFIRDTQSANGTFVNGRRLSTEGQDSYPHELKTDDIVVRIGLQPLSTAVMMRNC